MALLLYHLGHWCVRRRRYVLVAWLALLVVVALWAKAANGTTTDALSIPGTESQRAADLLGERFPAQSGATMRIAVEAPAGSKLADIVSPTQLDGDLKQLATLPNVVMPADPTSLVTVSPDGQIAFIEVRFDKPAAALDKAEIDVDHQRGPTSRPRCARGGLQRRPGVPRRRGSDVVDDDDVSRRTGRAPYVAPSTPGRRRSCRRDVTPSFVKILRRCHSTVRGLR